MFAIKHGIGELPYPVAQNHQSGLFAQHQIQFDVAMAEHEVIYILVALHILFGKAHQKLLLFAHIRLFLSVSTFQSAMLSPVQAQSHSPARMNRIKEALASMVLEHSFQELEFLVWVTQSVSMCQIEYFIVYLYGLRLVMYGNATLFLQVAIGPKVVVTRKEMYFHSHIGQLRELT